MLWKSAGSRELEGAFCEFMFTATFFAAALSWDQVPTALHCLPPSSQVQFHNAGPLIFVPAVSLSPDPLVWQRGLHLGQLLQHGHSDHTQPLLHPPLLPEEPPQAPGRPVPVASPPRGICPQWWHYCCFQGEAPRSLHTTWFCSMSTVPHSRHPVPALPDPAGQVLASSYPFP